MTDTDDRQTKKKILCTINQIMHYTVYHIIYAAQNKTWHCAKMNVLPPLMSQLLPYNSFMEK